MGLKERDLGRGRGTFLMKGRGIYGDGEVSSEREREFWRGTRNSGEGFSGRERYLGSRRGI